MARAVIDASTMLAGIPVEVTFADAFVCDAHASPVAVVLATWSVADETCPELLTFANSTIARTMTTAVPLAPLAWVEHLRQLLCPVDLACCRLQRKLLRYHKWIVLVVEILRN